MGRHTHEKSLIYIPITVLDKEFLCSLKVCWLQDERMHRNEYLSSLPTSGAVNSDEDAPAAYFSGILVSLKR